VSDHHSKLVATLRRAIADVKGETTVLAPWGLTQTLEVMAAKPARHLRKLPASELLPVLEIGNSRARELAIGMLGKVAP
jgi:hypothetical protein